MLSLEKNLIFALIFQKQVVPFLTQAFAPIISAIFNALAASASTVNDEEARLERQSLQRSYFSFIAAIVGSGLMEVLASQDPATLQQVLVSLVQGAVEYPDPVVISWELMPWDIWQMSLSLLGSKDMLFYSSSIGGNLGWQRRPSRVCRIYLQTNSARLLSSSTSRHIWPQWCPDHSSAHRKRPVPSSHSWKEGEIMILFKPTIDRFLIFLLGSLVCRAKKNSSLFCKRSTCQHWNYHCSSRKNFVWPWDLIKSCSNPITR